MNIIYNNPYRILGVFANSPKRDIMANKGKATAFLKVGRSVEYPLDLKGILPSLTRSIEQFNEAEAHLAIAKEQIKYAQFWFLKMTPLDEIAFNHLFAGKIDEAISIWSKQDNISSLQNKMICFLIKSSMSGAISIAQQLYVNFGDSYIEKIDSSCTLKMTGVELRNLYIDSLGESVGIMNLLSTATDADWKSYISNQTIGPLINKISSEVEKTKKIDHKDPNARINAARKLVTNTKEPFNRLKNILAVSDPQFQMIADKLGLEILQCGIDYFNNSEDDDAPHTAMKMQKYAQSIVVGTLAKQRCEENVKILQKIIDELPPKEVMAEDRAIKKELEKYTKLPDKITYAITLLNNTKPHLQAIKQKVGVGDKAYLDLSTLVVNNALHNVIEEVNAAQKKSSTDVLISCLREAWRAIVIMDEFDMDSSTKNSRYLPNRKTLKNLCDNLLPPNGTESYLQSIDFAIKNFNFDINGKNYTPSYFDYDMIDIESRLDPYQKTSVQKIEAVITLLRDTKQPLMSIRTLTSNDNAFYTKQSTRIASIALSTIIDVINRKQRDPMLSFHLQMGQAGDFKALMKKCYEAIELIDEMDVTPDFAKHYRSNRETIRKICVNIGVISNYGGSGEGCVITLFTILATAAMSIYCIISFL